jgi:hypothetical protein
MTESLTTPAAQPLILRISWAAIFAGLIVALGVELLLSLLGIGIGASMIHAVNGTSASASSIGIGSGIWFLVSTLIALFSGGWVAGRLAGMPLPIDGTLTAVGGILGVATGMLGSALGAAGSGVAAVAPSAAQAAGSQLQKSGVSTGSISSTVQSMLKETGNAKLSPDALQAEAHHQGQLAKNSAAA